MQAELFAASEKQANQEKSYEDQIGELKLQIELAKTEKEEAAREYESLLTSERLKSSNSEAEIRSLFESDSQSKVEAVQAKAAEEKRSLEATIQ